MATYTHNASEVLRSSRQLHRTMQGVTVQAVDAAADELRAAVRAGIPRSPGGRVGNFPGYAATGALWNDVARTRARRAGKIVSADVYMRPGRSRVYQRIHNDGGTIRAKNPTGYLTFKVRGQWVRVRQVRIRAKHYFDGPRVKGARTRIEGAMARVLGRLR